MFKLFRFVTDLFLGKKAIDAASMEELEEQLIKADLGHDATQRILQHLTEALSRSELKDSNALQTALRQILTDILKPCEQPLPLPPPGSGMPFVILMVGVNGNGKTTTIGKFAKQFQQQGYSVMLAAGDTFRAAAGEQLAIWGARNQVPVIAQPTGADSASVLYDALQAATARKIDILIADTAGRLHTKQPLLDELRKMKRVLQKIDPTAPHEVMLVLDAGTGQNALQQTSLFRQAIGVSGITITKLDGTAKGGIIFAIAHAFKLPIRYIGLGEGVDDLKIFEAAAFVEAIV
jgi:fused signal recognition particle receptor